MPTSLHVLRTFVAATLLVMRPGMGADVQSATGDVELDEVIITGERPGPAMWQVSKGAHTLWIMGTLSPLPANMTWRSRQAEQVIARSGEILRASTTRADLGGTLTILRHARALLRLRHNADGSTLHQTLPPDVHARWLAAYLRWFGEDPDPEDRTRPMFAGEDLYSQALARSGLSQRSLVWDTAQRVAGEHKVRIRQREFEVEITDVKGLISDIAAIPRDQDVACLVATLDFIDSELPQMKRRAVAWTVGDIEALRALPPENARKSCYQDVMRGSQLREMAEQQGAAIRQDWSGIVDWLLLTQETSFTTLPMQQLLDPAGPLANLRAKGYTVVEPL